VPHIIVEHTIGVSKHINELNKKLHVCLSEQETVSLSAVKTRSHLIQNAIVGDESITDFVHINILLLSGRSDELKKNMSDNIFDCAYDVLKESNLALSVNIDDLGTYKK